MIRKLILSFSLLVSLATFSQENFKIGDEVPEFKLWLTDGSKLTKNDILNKVVVFKFWFTGCLPCIIDIPGLNELVIEFEHRDDILFIAPALDRKDAIEYFTHSHPFIFKIAYSAMDVSEVFNKKQVYPSYFVIDKNGKFVYVDSDSKQSEILPLRKAILKALKE
ncbi:TlpA family protein disulfide reductase [Tenacibaculum sp. IB213877]|uniref:TlpA family protein disulfide reductase n=1 Tax=Tenacibaculum sp. IB213877 TaxID=3097351 RepID=UPI002A5A6D76|nr:redoxin domain-containing protein [Tenacibaculum sp. IB213877]MDY0781205.1 redoxin domain-containing protein [Tenacibaculum sp. IB213877]